MVCSCALVVLYIYILVYSYCTVYNRKHWEGSDFITEPLLKGILLQNANKGSLVMISEALI